MTDDEYQLTNRQKGQQTKLGWFWCVCDRQIVGLGRKCSVCGKRNIKNRRRLKNNEAFTLIELLVLLAIIVIVLAMTAAFVNVFKFLFWVLVYFSIPGIIFGVFLKLNQKYKWVVKGRYDRYLANFIDGEYMDNVMVNIHLNAYFILWPFYIPCFIVWVGGRELYHRYIKTKLYNIYNKKGGFFRMPTIDDKD